MSARQKDKATADKDRHRSRLNVLSSPWEPDACAPEGTSLPANGSAPTQVSARQKDKATEDKNTNRSRPSNVLSSPLEAGTFAPKEELDLEDRRRCAQRNESDDKKRRRRKMRTRTGHVLTMF